MKKKRGIEIKINLSKRWLYTLIVIGILAIVGVGVWAATYTASGGGHPYTEISACDDEEILQMVGGSWGCVGMPSGESSLWTQAGNDIYYNTGDVGIGITNLEAELHVDGDIKAEGRIYIGGEEYFYQGGRSIIQTTSSIISSATIQGAILKVAGSTVGYHNSCSDDRWGQIRRCTGGDSKSACICAYDSTSRKWRWEWLGE